jgi:hypothetical protein
MQCVNIELAKKNIDFRKWLEGWPFHPVWWKTRGEFDSGIGTGVQVERPVGRAGSASRG